MMLMVVRGKTTMPTAGHMYAKALNVEAMQREQRIPESSR